MASIIRSPSVSPQKRKLSSRRARAASTEATSPTEAPAPQGNAASQENRAPAVSTPVDVKELVEQARLSVLAQFKEEAEKARELGRQRGLQEGRQAGAEEMKKEFASEIARIRAIADNLRQVATAELKHVEENAVAIAFEALCKMLGETAVSKDGIRALVHQAVTHTHATQRLVVRLHPADLALLNDSGALDAAFSAGGDVSWSADKSIALGGCVVTTDAGELDARLETQVEQLKTALLAARGA